MINLKSGEGAVEVFQPRKPNSDHISQETVLSLSNDDISLQSTV